MKSATKKAANVTTRHQWRATNKEHVTQCNACGVVKVIKLRPAKLPRYDNHRTQMVSYKSNRRGEFLAGLPPCVPKSRSAK